MSATKSEATPSNSGGQFLLPRKLLKLKIVHPELNGLYEDHGPCHRGDSGVDLFCPEDVEVKCGETKLVDLGVQCEMLDAVGGAQSFYLHPRSSLGTKTPLIMANSAGVIDAGYRGNLMACVKYVPTTEDLMRVAHMPLQAVQSVITCVPTTEDLMRVAHMPLQAVQSVIKTQQEQGGDVDALELPTFTIKAGTRLFQICAPSLDPVVVHVVDQLSESDRGAGGFGSTGQ